MTSHFNLSHQTFALQKNVVANGQQHSLMIFAQSITVSVATQSVQNNAQKPTNKPVAKNAPSSLQQSNRSLPQPSPQTIDNTTPKPSTNKPEWFSKNADITTIEPEAGHIKPESKSKPSIGEIFGISKPSKETRNSPSNETPTDFWNRPSWA